MTALTDGLVAEPPPIQTDAHRVFRVGGTRVRLETIIRGFQNRCTPEELLQKYPSLTLADIYAVIGYYLRHPSVLEVYLQEACKAMEESEREIRDRSPTADIRERLLARRASKP